MSTQPHDGETAIRGALGVLHEPGTMMELRLIRRSGVVSGGFFTDPAALARAAMQWDGRAHLYVTLNPLDPAMPSRAGHPLNRLSPKSKPLTQDADIIRRVWLLLDFDGVRVGAGKKVSTTDAEKVAALAVAARCQRWLVDELGFPAASIVPCDSGNGAHLLVRIDLPNDDASLVLVNHCLAAVALRFDDSDVRVDQSVGNGGRITKAYGGMTCKGPNTPERPWRRSAMTMPTEAVVPAPRGALERLAALSVEADEPPPPAPVAPSRTTSRPSGSRFVVERWLSGYGFQVVHRQPFKDGELLRLDRCPLEPEHDRSYAACIIVGADGRIGFKCFGARCAGKGWRDVRDALEPESRERRERWEERQRGRAARPALRPRIAVNGAEGFEAEEEAVGDSTGADERGQDKTADQPRARFKLLRLADVLKTRSAPSLVEGRIGRGQFGLIYGDAGACKTFLALDLSLHIANGLPWLGAPVTRGAVVYVAAEGSGGMRKRMLAWQKHHPGVTADPDVYMIHEALDPLNAADMGALQEQLRALPEQPILVVLDTWSRCITAGRGDEDRASDVAPAVEALARMSRELGGATILVIHHEGHAAKGRARGSSALRGAADVEIALAEKDDVITVRNTKQRDLGEFAAIRLQKLVIDLPELDDLPEEERTSLVLVPADAASEPRPADISREADAVLALLPTEGATYTAWRQRAGLPETTFRRHREELLKAGFVSKPADQKRGLYKLTILGEAYRHNRQNTASGGNGGSKTYSRQPPHPYRGGGVAVMAAVKDGGGREEEL